MSTWMHHAFGGDKVIMMPNPLNATASATLNPLAGHDNSTGKWWVCPSFGYDMVACAGCQGPKMRCVSHYKLAFRYEASLQTDYVCSLHCCLPCGIDQSFIRKLLFRLPASQNSAAGTHSTGWAAVWLHGRYITSMYWAYTTMTTVGYGDISSTTMAEKLWAIITMIVSGFFFSFVVGRMASVVAKLDSHRTAYNEKLEVVTTFLKDTNLPRQLSKR